MSEKVDLYQLHKNEYVTPRSPVLLPIARAQYLAIEGRGEPGGEAFEEAVGALYSVAFTIKMASKSAGRDYSVAKLEAQWWLDAGSDFQAAPKDTWNWRVMIRTPDFIGRAEMVAAHKALAAKGKPDLVQQVHLMTLEEGMCVQLLHSGSYDREPESIAQMRSHAEAQGYRFHALHHEIYLSDPRRIQPEKLRTILRVPVRQ